MPQKVFISHKDSDSITARQVAQRVKQNGLSVYLDVIDPALRKDGPDLADYLLERMSQCQQLIAVISRETQASWWVPWEIGVGSEKNFRMATYATQSATTVPEYLRKWPVLRSGGDIDTYCRTSQQSLAAQRILESRGNVSTASIRKSASDSFHRNLKSALGQR